ncbi:MAG: hypothetical protein IJ083_05935 [Clostridia bacterium]|nr:hypothetical protein [Clostridia bacterium]
MKKSKFAVMSLVCAVLTCVCALIYAFSVSRDHSAVIIASMAVAAVCCVVLSLRKIPVAEYVPFVLTLISLAIFIRLGFDEIGDILSKNNMNGLSASWIASAVLLVLSSVCTGVNTVLAADVK